MKWSHFRENVRYVKHFEDVHPTALSVILKKDDNKKIERNEAKH